MEVNKKETISDYHSVDELKTQLKTAIATKKKYSEWHKTTVVLEAAGIVNYSNVVIYLCKELLMWKGVPQIEALELGETEDEFEMDL